jgi:RNA polymerase-interacting CarD/CdnL/TRCF family regulator
VASFSQTTFIPIATADAMMRPLVSRDTALERLKILRRERVQPGAELEMSSRRMQRVLREGSPAEHAEFLRQLYALPETTFRQQKAILTFEDLAIAEIAEVLGEKEDALTSEMRRRYPGFGKRVGAYGPGVVAAPVGEVPAGIKPR